MRFYLHVHNLFSPVSKLIFACLFKMVWIETPTNPTMRLVDIQAVCKVVHEKAPKDCFVVVDNTFMSSYFQVFIANSNFIRWRQVHSSVAEILSIYVKAF